MIQILRKSLPGLALAGAIGLSLLAAATPTALAQSGDASAAVRQSVESWLKGRYKVDEVRKTPLGTMYEVRLGTDLIYVDEKGQYAFIEGSMVELKSGRNLTQERLDQVLTINFKDLPLDLALKQVNGNGKRIVAVFEDPNCGYCKQLRRDLVKLENATIYTFIYPILAPDSDVKSRQVLCAADKGRAWNELMLNNKVPGNSGTCDNSLEKLREAGRKLNISATPTIFFANGKRLQGYVQPSKLEQMLDENGKS